MGVSDILKEGSGESGPQPLPFKLKMSRDMDRAEKTPMYLFLNTIFKRCMESGDSESAVKAMNRQLYEWFGITDTARFLSTENPTDICVFTDAIFRGKLACATCHLCKALLDENEIDRYARVWLCKKLALLLYVFQHDEHVLAAAADDNDPKKKAHKLVIDMLLDELFGTHEAYVLYEKVPVLDSIVSAISELCYESAEPENVAARIITWMTEPSEFVTTPAKEHE